MYRILIADDHQIVIDGLSAILKDNGFDDIVYAHDGREAMERVNQFNPQLIFMDIDMPNMNGLEATRNIKLRHHDIKILILSMHEEGPVIKKALATGADGYLIKNAGQDTLLEAIKAVMSGKSYLSPEAQAAIEPHAKHHDFSTQPSDTLLLASLTEREIEIIKCIAKGMTNKEIGDSLFISHRTVDTHRTNVMRKLDVNNIAGIIRFAFKHGLTE